jgi:ABC-2 type transport system ATP-binding protein
MEEAEYLADRVAIISKGKIITEGAPSDLVDVHCKTAHLTIRRGSEKVGETAAELGLSWKALGNGDYHMDVKSSDELLSILNMLKERGITYEGLDVRKGNLEEVFLSLTGEALREGGDDI